MIAQPRPLAGLFLSRAASPERFLANLQTILQPWANRRRTWLGPRAKRLATRNGEWKESRTARHRQPRRYMWWSWLGSSLGTPCRTCYFPSKYLSVGGNTIHALPRGPHRQPPNEGLRPKQSACLRRSGSAACALAFFFRRLDSATKSRC